MVGYTNKSGVQPGFKSNSPIPLEISTTMLHCLPKTSVKEPELGKSPRVFTMEETDKQSD